MKKILCLIDTLGIGGAERQMVGLTILLKRKGYDVDLVSYHNDRFYASIAQEEGINPIFLNVENSLFSKFNVIRAFVKQHGKYDCIITYKGGSNSIGCLLKIVGCRSRLIVSERSTTQTLTRSDKQRFWLYRFADFIVPNSYSQCDFLSNHYPRLAKKIIPITNFTDTTLFSPLLQVIRNKQMLIMTAARISKAKNLINYLKAISILKKRGVLNVHFDWYGGEQRGEENYCEEVYKAVKELGIEEMITFYPNVANIVDYYRQCDIFCLPSIYEGFPNAICEAMSCGKPILCSRVCDNPKIVSEGENGLFFEPDNVEDITEKLISIISLPSSKLREMGNFSRKLAIERFSEEVFVKKYINLIES